MRAIESYLDVMYPELQQENGLLTFRTREFNLRGDDLRVSFVQCRVGSGVPAGSVKPTLPNCDVFYESGTSEFLALTFRTGTHKFPIYRFGAKGNFFGRREELLEKTKAHPEWSDKERLDSLTEVSAARSCDAWVGKRETSCALIKKETIASLTPGKFPAHVP
jgi:hypothetical protein